MERVKKALEKAQSQRKNSKAQQPESLSKDSRKELKIREEIAYLETKIVEVSDDTFRQNRVVAALKEDHKADLFKILRTKIIQRMRANNWRVLAITSPTAGVGKSLVASNVAISLAMDANYSVVLADLDLRRPSIHKYFGIEPEHGISDHFDTDKPVSELLINPGIESLVILPAGKPIRRSSELLSTPKMQELASELKHRYADRIVIVDLPPLLHTDDAMVFMPNVDACILVTAEGDTTEDEIKRSLELIDETKYMGTILNKSQDKQADGYYYY